MRHFESHYHVLVLCCQVLFMSWEKPASSTSSLVESVLPGLSDSSQCKHWIMSSTITQDRWNSLIWHDGKAGVKGAGWHFGKYAFLFSCWELNEKVDPTLMSLVFKYRVKKKTFYIVELMASLFLPGWHPNPWPSLDTLSPWHCTQSTSTSSLSRGVPNLELYWRAEPSCTEPVQSCYRSSTLNSSTWCTEEQYMWTQEDQTHCKVSLDRRLNFKQNKTCKKLVFVSSFYVCLHAEKVLLPS